MSGTEWVSEAPCVGDPRFTIRPTWPAFAGKLPQLLLRVCQGCPFRSECIELVLPRKARFDGVCGGRLFLDGQIYATCQGADPDELTEQGTYIAHGTEAGARAHNRLGEPACAWCREAGRIAQAQRRAKKRAERTDHPNPPQGE